MSIVGIWIVYSKEFCNIFWYAVYFVYPNRLSGTLSIIIFYEKRYIFNYSCLTYAEIFVDCKIKTFEDDKRMLEFCIWNFYNEGFSGVFDILRFYISKFLFSPGATYANYGNSLKKYNYSSEENTSNYRNILPS